MATALRTCFLVLACAALTLAAAESGAADHKFGGSRKCRSCHRKEAIGAQYQAWEASRHAKAFETLASDKAREWGAKAGVEDPQTSEKCLRCHVTAYGEPQERLGRNYDQAEGVQCEACHGAGMDYGKKKIMVDRDRAVEKGLVLQSEKVCVKCHNDESPAWDPERYTLADGAKVGFDYDQALEEIAHPVPEGYDAMAEGEAD